MSRWTGKVLLRNTLTQSYKFGKEKERKRREDEVLSLFISAYLLLFSFQALKNILALSPSMLIRDAASFVWLALCIFHPLKIVKKKNIPLGYILRWICPSAPSFPLLCLTKRHCVNLIRTPSLSGSPGLRLGFCLQRCQQQIWALFFTFYF